MNCEKDIIMCEPLACRRTKEEINNLSLGEVLESVGLKSIKAKPCGPGWVGTKYIVNVYNQKPSHPLESMEDVRLWLIKNCEHHLWYY